MGITVFMTNRSAINIIVRLDTHQQNVPGIPVYQTFNRRTTTFPVQIRTRNGTVKQDGDQEIAETQTQIKTPLTLMIHSSSRQRQCHGSELSCLLA